MDHELDYTLIEGERRERLLARGCRLAWSWLPARRPESAGAIVYLHGVASNGSRWEEFAEKTRLRERWDMIRLDLRGHAASEYDGRARLEDWCRDVADILDAAGQDRAVVVGHSLGAQVAMRFAASYPGRTRGAVLVDPLVDAALTPYAARQYAKRPYLKAAEKAGRLALKAGLGARLKRQDLRAMDARARRKIAAGGKELEDFVRDYSSAANDLQYITLAAYARDLLEVGRETPPAEALACPALVIGADSGTYTDAGAMRRWVGGLRDGQFATVHCRHWPVTECLEEIMDVVEGWFALRLEGETPGENPS